MSLTLLNEKMFLSQEKERKINAHYHDNKTNYRYKRDVKEDYNDDLKNYGFFNFVIINLFFGRFRSLFCKKQRLSGYS